MSTKNTSTRPEAEPVSRLDYLEQRIFFWIRLLYHIDLQICPSLIKGKLCNLTSESKVCQKMYLN